MYIKQIGFEQRFENDRNLEVMNLVIVAELKEIWKQKSDLSCLNLQQDWPSDTPQVENLNGGELLPLTALTLYHSSRKNTEYITWTIRAGESKTVIVGKSMCDARITQTSPSRNEAHDAWLKTLNLTEVVECERTLRLRPWWKWQDFAQAGWYFLGVSDRTRCFSCKGLAQNWRDGGDPLLRHLESYPWCDFAQQRKRELEVIMQAGNDMSKYDEVSQTFEFPLTTPANPTFAKVAKRSKTFKSTNLPCDVKNSVRAGFYWLGVADRIKCCYCNGGLQRLSIFDNLFVEHAKWFPHCEYTNRVLGVPLVRRIAKYYNRVDHRAGCVDSHVSVHD